jgi:hypothetical protein
MLSFCDDLLDDMDFEDRELLSEKLFAGVAPGRESCAP